MNIKIAEPPKLDPADGYRRVCRLQTTLSRGGHPGGFEILAITAGEGNGWHFPPQVLRESLALWEGVETFIDHTAEYRLRSVRDLAGICSSPRWDDSARGIRLTLNATGPSADVLARMGREWLDSPEPRPRLGFSADLLFTAQSDEQTVLKILKVFSLDLVYQPARGGAFLEEVQKAPMQTDPIYEFFMQAFQGGMMTANQPQSDIQPVQPVLPGIDPPQPTPEELSAALLEARLGQAGLPARLAGTLRSRFAGRAFPPAELETAISEARSLVAELQGGRTITGTPPLSTVTAEERLQAAVDDLLGAPREPNMTNAHVERLSGIRELYTMLTGDLNLTGGCNPRHMQLETTATMPRLVNNALNQLILQHPSLLHN